jgi:hypothetical protein
MKVQFRNNRMRFEEPRHGCVRNMDRVLIGPVYGWTRFQIEVPVIR